MGARPLRLCLSVAYARGVSGAERKGNSGTMPGVSAYLTFANDQRATVREELLKAQGGEGKIGIAQLGKELGSRWRQLPDEEKERYKQLASELNEKRTAERAAAAKVRTDSEP